MRHIKNWGVRVAVVAVAFLLAGLPGTASALTLNTLVQTGTLALSPSGAQTASVTYAEYKTGGGNWVTGSGVSGLAAHPLAPASSSVDTGASYVFEYQIHNTGTVPELIFNQNTTGALTSVGYLTGGHTSEFATVGTSVPSSSVVSGNTVSYSFGSTIAAGASSLVLFITTDNPGFASQSGANLWFRRDE